MASSSHLPHPSTCKTFSAFPSSLPSRRNMMWHILEQPHSISQTVLLQKSQAQEFAETLGKASKVSVLSCGSSYHVGQFFKYAMEGSPILVDVVDQPLSYSGKSPVSFFISQSGETGDLMPALEQARSHFSFCVALTNSPKSALARKSDLVVPTFAPDESGLVPAIGSMTGAVASAFHVASIFQQSSHPGSGKLSDIALGSEIGLFLRSAERRSIGCVVDLLKGVQYIHFAGEGAMRWVAEEAALKVKETAEILTSAGSMAGSRHGFLSAFGSRIPIIQQLPKALVLFAEPQDRMLVAQYAALANKHGVPIITVGCGKGCKFSISYDILPPGAKNSTQAGRIISAIAFSQMISHDLAVHYGLEPGSSKINTKW